VQGRIVADLQGKKPAGKDHFNTRIFTSQKNLFSNHLEKDLAKAQVNNIDHACAGEDGGKDNGDDSKHSKAAVDELCVKKKNQNY
jgi:hypothetical protein